MESAMGCTRGSRVLLVTLVLSVLSPRAFPQQSMSPQEIPPVRAQLFSPTESFTSELVGEERRQNRFEDAIETDRDSFTPATTTAGRRRLIVESAYSFIDNRDVKE